MSFFHVTVYPSFMYGAVIMFSLKEMYLHYKKKKQEEIDLSKKYYELYYRVTQLEEQVGMLQTTSDTKLDTFIHE